MKKGLLQKIVTATVATGTAAFLDAAMPQTVQGQEAIDEILRGIIKIIPAPAKKFVYLLKAESDSQDEGVLCLAKAGNLHPTRPIAVQVEVIVPGSQKPVSVVKKVEAGNEVVLGPLQVVKEGRIQNYNYRIKSAEFID